MPEGIAVVAVQHNLKGGAGVHVHGNGTAQVHCAFGHRVTQDTDGVECDMFAGWVTQTGTVLVGQVGA